MNALAPIQEERPGDLWAIEARQLRKQFGSKLVLESVDLQIPEGVIAVILGPSGTGKSVLIKHVIGLLRPDAGEMLIRGQPLSRMRRVDLLALRRDCGILFQDGALFGSMSVFENVAFPLRQHTDLQDSEIAEVVEERLAEMGLGAAGHRMPAEISGGMRKRAGLARALVLEPTMMLFDEPDSGLDPVRTALLCEYIEATHANHGGTYVVITHDITVARQIADYVAVLWQGRIVQSGLKDEVFESADPFVAQLVRGETRGPLGME